MIEVDKHGFTATVSELPEVGTFILLTKTGTNSVLMFPPSQLEAVIDVLKILQTLIGDKL